MKNKYLPYVRLANGKEKSESLRVAVKLAFYRAVLKMPFYVMVQRGFPNHVIACGDSKREVMQSIFVVATGRQTFRQWTKHVQAKANPKKADKSVRAPLSTDA